jgi:glyoxylase-like metal-dependent hydrolase (beta-lactamase superfamily II)
MAKRPLTQCLLAALTFAACASSAVIVTTAEAAPQTAPSQKRTVAGYYRLMLGKFEITALSDGTVTIPLNQLLTHGSQNEINDVMRRAGVDPANTETSINAFLIHTGSRLALIDAGAGSVFPNGGHLAASLRAAGYRPEDITDVMLTHIHPDHSAGLTIKGKAVFPNATVHVQERDAAFWLDANNAAAYPQHAHAFAQARLDLAPYLKAGRVRRFSGDEELVPGVRAVAAPGHTPGHSFYAVESEGQKLLLWGDLIHGKDAQFHAPGIAIQFDVDETAAAAQRARAMADAAANGYLVGAAHISFPGIGRVVRDGASYLWMPVNYSEAGLRHQAK